MYEAQSYYRIDKIWSISQLFFPALRRWIKNSLFGTAKGLLENLVVQDVAMIKQEQEAYLANLLRRNYELNPAVAKITQLVINQFQATGI